jgi:hypothetical protein
MLTACPLPLLPDPSLRGSLLCPLSACSDLARDIGQTDYTVPDTSTSIQASAGGSSCSRFCLWGKGGKAYHPPAGDMDTAPMAFL